MSNNGGKFDQHTLRISNEAQIILNEIPGKIEQLDDIMSTLFPMKLPSEAEKTFASIVNEQASKNDVVLQTLSTVRDEVFTAIVSMQKIERWIQLSVPVIEDGNNFGVEVQRAVLQQVSGSKLSLQTGFDSFIDYTWQRGLAYEKFAKKITKEKSKNVGSTTTKDSKEGDETKLTNGDLEKETETHSSPISDFVSYVIAVDVKWYFNLKRILECVRDHYAFSYDAIRKNKAKIIMPRGQSSTMHMF